MKNNQVKKTAIEITDMLFEIDGFSEWWCQLDDVVEKEIHDKIEQIIEKRLNGHC